MEQIGAAALPVIIGVILLFGFFKGVDVFDAFVSGAKEGIHTTLGLLPTLIGLIVAVSMVRASGLLDALCALCEPLANAAAPRPIPSPFWSSSARTARPAKLPRCWPPPRRPPSMR